MRILDANHTLNSEHIIKLRDNAVKRLKTYDLEKQINAIKVLPGGPESEFEDDEKTIIVLHIEPYHFSKSNAEFIILHEIQHRIDELTPSFGYSKQKKEKLRQRYDQHCKHFSAILAHLWDIYINGRLYQEGLYETDPNETITIRGQPHNRTPYANRRADIYFLECRGFHDAEQGYENVWNAKDRELNYDQLAHLAVEGLNISGNFK